MTRYILCALLFSALGLSGCANKLDVAVNAIPDPDYHFDRQAPVLITTEGQDESSLNTRYYLKQVEDALKGRGYQAIFTERTRDSARAPIKLILSINVDSKRIAYRYSVTNYAHVPVSSTSTCKPAKKSKDKSLTCTTVPTTVYTPVGSSEHTGYTTRSLFSLVGKDNLSRQTVLTLRASSDNDDCQAAKVEAFLVEQGLQRLSFEDRVAEKYSVTLPDGYSCR